MEDFRIDIMVGKGAGRHAHPARPRRRSPWSARRPASGLLPNPLRDRFGFTGAPRVLRDRRARAGARARSRRPARRRRSTARRAAEIAGRSRGTPRIANRLLRRVRDYALVRGDGDARAAAAARPRSSSTRSTTLGLDRLDRAVLDGARHALRRRAGRAQHARRGGRRGARDDRDGRRAVPRARGADRPHAARPRRDARGLGPPRASTPADGGRRCSLSRPSALGRSPDRRGRSPGTAASRCRWSGEPLRLDCGGHLPPDP